MMYSCQGNTAILIMAVTKCKLLELETSALGGKGELTEAIT